MGSLYSIIECLNNQLRTGPSDQGKPVIVSIFLYSNISASNVEYLNNKLRTGPSNKNNLYLSQYICTRKLNISVFKSQIFLYSNFEWLNNQHCVRPRNRGKPVIVSSFEYFRIKHSNI